MRELNKFQFKIEPSELDKKLELKEKQDLESAERIQRLDKRNRPNKFVLEDESKQFRKPIIVEKCNCDTCKNNPNTDGTIYRMKCTRCNHIFYTQNKNQNLCKNGGFKVNGEFRYKCYSKHFKKLRMH